MFIVFLPFLGRVIFSSSLLDGERQGHCQPERKKIAAYRLKALVESRG